MKDNDNAVQHADLLELLLVLVAVALLHVALLGFGITECNEALETLQVVVLVCNTTGLALDG